MPQSLATRLEAVQKALEAQRPKQLTIPVRIVCCETREEADAILALPATPPPDPTTALVTLQPTYHSAADYLSSQQPQQPTQ